MGKRWQLSKLNQFTELKQRLGTPWMRSIRCPKQAR